MPLPSSVGDAAKVNAGSEKLPPCADNASYALQFEPLSVRNSPFFWRGRLLHCDILSSNTLKFP